MVKVYAEIIAIGSDAIVPQDQTLILFGPQATTPLAQVAVIQQFSENEQQHQLELAVGDTMTLAQQTYQIVALGSSVLDNLRTIGHVSLFFHSPKSTPIPSGLYLTASQSSFPSIAVGSKIIYEHHE